MITPNNPFATPGFFESPFMPSVPSILPGVIDMGGPPILPQVSPKDQQNYMTSVMSDFFNTYQNLQQSFAMYLGRPAPPLGQPALGAPSTAAPKAEK